MEPVKMPAGYRLPKGMNMADVRRMDQELLAGEMSPADGKKAKSSLEKSRDKKK